MKYCMNCGAENADGAEFCSACAKRTFTLNREDYLRVKFGGSVFAEPETETKPDGIHILTADTEEYTGADGAGGYGRGAFEDTQGCLDDEKTVECEEEAEEYEETELSEEEREESEMEFSGCGEDFCVEDGVLSDYDGEDMRVQIPEGIKHIGEFAFCQMQIESVKFLSALESIGESAFGGCEKLKELNFPESLTDIGEGAFEDCVNLEKAVLPYGVNIGESAFKVCESLKEINIEAAASIGSEAFKYCFALEKVVLPEIENIPDYAFYNCWHLKDVYFPDCLAYIGGFAFSGCSSLESLVLPAGLKIIDNFAFEECCALETVDLPDGLENLGGYAFGGCTFLESVFIPASVKTAGKRIFNSNGLCTVYCEAAQRPEGWDKDWDVVRGGLFGKKRVKVIWGAKRPR